MSHQPKRWVIIFLIYADFRIKPSQERQDQEAIPFPMNEEMKIELDLMFKEILTTPINPDNARLYVILNGVTYKKKNEHEVVIDSKTILYELSNPGSKVSNQIEKVCLFSDTVLGSLDASQDDLQNPDKLSEIFKRIEVEEGEDVFLITWDHGSAFGIFRVEDPTAPISIEIRRPISHELDKYPYLRAFWERAAEKGFSSFVKNDNSKNDIIIQAGYNLYTLRNRDEEVNLPEDFIITSNLEKALKVKQKDGRPVLLLPNDNALPFVLDKKKHLVDIFKKGVPLEDKVTEILKNDELAKSLKCWLGDKKVGVLLMMNCWMMNMHTMYSLRETVQCIVAPQTNIANPGYNYRDILRFLYKPQSCYKTNQQLAVKCVTTSENKYAIKRAKKINEKSTNENAPIDTWKIFALDLSAKDVDGKSLLCKQIFSLRSLIDILNQFIQTKTKSEIKWMLKYVRSVCFDFTNNNSIMVDIVNWSLSIIYADEDFAGGNSRLFPAIETAIKEFSELIVREYPAPSVVLKSTKGKLVYAFGSSALKPVAVIDLPPTGYSLFFPICNFDNKPHRENFMDNITTDSLLNTVLLNWKNFLSICIDKRIIF